MSGNRSEARVRNWRFADPNADGPLTADVGHPRTASFKPLVVLQRGRCRVAPNWRNCRRDRRSRRHTSTGGQFGELSARCRIEPITLGRHGRAQRSWALNSPSSVLGGIPQLGGGQTEWFGWTSRLPEPRLLGGTALCSLTRRHRSPRLLWRRSERAHFTDEGR
jgi:hypothetical protein